MKTQTHRIAIWFVKIPAIYQSEHDPFLSGNIARRGVIGTISRKAISPLMKSMIAVCKSGDYFYFLQRAWLYRYKQTVKLFQRGNWPMASYSVGLTDIKSCLSVRCLFLK